MTDLNRAVREHLNQLDGTDEAAVALITGMSRSDLADLGGIPADSKSEDRR